MQQHRNKIIHRGEGKGFVKLYKEIKAKGGQEIKKVCPPIFWLYTVKKQIRGTWGT